jgi:mannose-6-phosphate isomerase
LAIEHARARALPKPWGIVDLLPWSMVRQPDHPIGEIWFERADTTAPNPSLLLKLLFTSQPLSIQVHPDDAYAHSIGLRRGKTEAWYVLRADPGSKIALGLKERLTSQQLHKAIDNGSILDLVRWQSVSADETIFVPAGTIHAIGAGVVIAEIQQRSDTTFRLFDFGRQRELHKEKATAVAVAAPAGNPVAPSRLSDQRLLLVANKHFVFERMDLPPNTSWRVESEREAWLLVIRGAARIGLLDAGVGEGIFIQADRVDLQSGPAGLTGLVAYTGSEPLPNLLQRSSEAESIHAGAPESQIVVLPQADAISTNKGLEIIR